MRFAGSAIRRCCLALGVFVSTAILLCGCGAPAGTQVPAPAAPLAISTSAIADARVVPFCGGCHPLPDPGSFAQRDWREEVLQGFRLHMDSGRVDLKAPSIEAAAQYFESRAPLRTELDPLLCVAQRDSPSPVQFRTEVVPVDAPPTAAVARVQVLGAAFPGLFVTDMSGGRIWRFEQFDRPQPPLWRVSGPAAVAVWRAHPQTPPGLVIADLGGYIAEDHHLGAVWQVAAVDQDPRLLLSGLARVSHVATGDLDGDGDDDLVVSEYGWRRSGRLLVYWNDQPQGEWPHLTLSVVDPRHGALRAEIADLDGDGRPEIIAAFAQEYESVDAYRLSGERQFERVPLYHAPDPSWGTSDFSLVDLDADGRMDVLVCHGDSMDGGDLRPHHGVTWLRQTEALKFEPRRLCVMPGAHHAEPGDYDGDGDLDVFLVSMCPDSVLQDPERPRLASIAWLEQLPNLEFRPHVLEWEACRHTTCAALDVDGDQDLDVVVGWHLPQGDNPPLLTLCRNQGRAPASAP